MSDLDPPTSPDPFARSRWLRTYLWSSARTFAGIEALGGDCADYTAWECAGWLEVLGASVGKCADLGWPNDLARLAAQSAWARAKSDATRLDEALTRRLWRLGATRAPGAEIMAAARAECDRAGIYVPEPVLLEAARRIALAAARPSRRRA